MGYLCSPAVFAEVAITDVAIVASCTVLVALIAELVAKLASIWFQRLRVFLCIILSNPKVISALRFQRYRVTYTDSSDV